jgi:hypothetical protein
MVTKWAVPPPHGPCPLFEAVVDASEPSSIPSSSSVPSAIVPHNLRRSSTLCGEVNIVDGRRCLHGHRRLPTCLQERQNPSLRNR